MTRKQLNLAIFEKKAKEVLWQPRLETWILYNRAKGTLPERFSDLTNLEIYDRLGCSIRYGAYAGLVYYYSCYVETFERRIDDNHTEIITRTEKGTLRTVFQIVPAGLGYANNRRIVEFPVKTVEDLKIVTYMINHLNVAAVPELFQEAATRVGDRAEPTIFLTSAGFTESIKTHAGLLNTFYLLNDYPAEFEQFIEACNERDIRVAKEALKLPCRIFNLGDHVTNEFTPPPILKKYVISRWEKISQLMSENNRFVHSHWDGNSRLILPYLVESGLHGVEALTPAPMCDMTLEEIYNATDGMVVLDLIPAIFFLPSFPLKELVSFTEKVIEMFMPRLILGVSDEIPPAGEIDRIEAISELIDKKFGLPD
ncbi:MAG: hypothetical protein NC902_08910 [Candidatus Omnitrophica bacterium]|nr:hypothetical protein [Candidatus Omnitrophota bacterium]